MNTLGSPPSLSVTAILLCTLGLSCSLRIEDVSIPEYKVRGSSARLTCTYSLGDFTLYSLKWYKGDKQFYQYIPGNKKTKNTFVVPGVNVDVDMTVTSLLRSRLTCLLVPGVTVTFQVDMTVFPPPFQVDTTVTLPSFLRSHDSQFQVDMTVTLPSFFQVDMTVTLPPSFQGDMTVTFPSFQGHDSPSLLRSRLT
ncbi:hypothetical protein C7M84_010965 [Penaeus vannamei]|uniref:Ig-like domain-containing protein n=1 Tax=Penaeus vannamei TaxID=6689 RepID=A0A3R7M204_PENVA|nr:hypothetical protein C7M84_010965 [Penaeus vannamei]